MVSFRDRKIAVLVALALISLTVAGCARNAGSSTVSSLQSINPLGPLERKLVFPAAKYPEGNWQPEGLGQEEVYFTSSDGTALHGWLVRHPNPRAVVLYSHGNGGNVTHRAQTLRLLRDRIGVTVMAYDYRGYGRSDGSPDEAGILSDARAARAELARRTGTREADIVLMGRSLGGGVAVDLAAADGARGLILESTFTSLTAAADANTGWMPVSSIMSNHFDSLSKIGRYRGPLLQSHGDADRVIPFTQGEQLFAAASGPKRFVRIHGGDHNDPQTEEYYTELIRFLDGAALQQSVAGRSWVQE